MHKLPTIIPAAERYHAKLVAAKANKPLTAAVNELHQLNQAEDFAYEEMDAFGAPGECGHLIARGIDADREKIAAKYGFLNYRVLLDVIAKRVSDKWLYQSGICR